MRGLFVSGPKFTNFFRPRWVTVVDHLLVRSSIYPSGSFKKLYPNCHACLVARHVEKIRDVTPPGAKVIGAHTLNFKPIFECSVSLDQTATGVKF